jgi:hypothetical protein
MKVGVRGCSGVLLKKEKKGRRKVVFSVCFVDYRDY